MCQVCQPIDYLFEAACTDPHPSYVPTFDLLRTMAKEGKLEFYAGDCPLDDMERHLEEERHFTIQHYFRCVACGQFFFIGACIRGTPAFEKSFPPAPETLTRILWGHCGTFYEGRGIPESKTQQRAAGMQSIFLRKHK